MRGLLVGCLLGLMLSPAWSRASCTAASSPDGKAPSPVVSLFLLVEAESFLCTPCLDRVLSGVRDIARLAGGATLWSVVLYSAPTAGQDEESYQSIVARRAESVLRANGFDGPLIIDRASRWNGTSLEGTGLLVLDSRTRSARRFSLPLAPEALSLVTRILTEGGTHDPYRDHP